MINFFNHVNHAINFFNHALITVLMHIMFVIFFNLFVNIAFAGGHRRPIAVER